jgi:hypothetical protein
LEGAWGNRLAPASSAAGWTQPDASELTIDEFSRWPREVERAAARKQYVTDEQKARENLERLGLWTAPPKVAKARAPQHAEQLDPPSQSDGVDPPAPDDVA